MLSRKEARKLHCPINTVLDKFTFTQKILQAPCKEHKGAFKKLASCMSCKADKCPKWKDEFIVYEGIKSHCADFGCAKCGSLEDYVNICLKCNKHFGRCGG